jgi:hypothetical protein
VKIQPQWVVTAGKQTNKQANCGFECDGLGEDERSIRFCLTDDLENLLFLFPVTWR